MIRFKKIKLQDVIYNAMQCKSNMDEDVCIVLLKIICVCVWVTLFASFLSAAKIPRLFLAEKQMKVSQFGVKAVLVSIFVIFFTAWFRFTGEATAGVGAGAS